MLQSSTSGAEFIKRHIGPNDADTQKMLEAIGAKSLNELIEKTSEKIMHPNEITRIMNDNNIDFVDINFNDLTTI